MNQNEAPLPIDADEPLTIWDYINQPLKLLFEHPDYDQDRMNRVTLAFSDALRFIAAHEAELEAILAEQGPDPE